MVSFFYEAVDEDVGFTATSPPARFAWAEAGNNPPTHDV